MTTYANAINSKFGEYISSSIAIGSAVSVSLNTATDVTSISLTAGDWEVYGNVVTAPNGATITSNFVAWISTTSATLPTLPNGGGYSQLSGFSTAVGQLVAFPTGNIRINVAVPTTVYLSTYITFAGGVTGAYGFIGARRLR